MAQSIEPNGDAVTAWLREMSLGRGISSHTDLAYKSDVNEFIKFLTSYLGGAIGVDALANLTPREMRAFLADCQKREVGAASRNRKLSAIKSFLRYVFQENGLKNDAILMSRGPKKPARLPRPLSMVDASLVIESAAELDKRPWIRARDGALLTLLYACGLRISEALNITLSQLPLGPELRIEGKGRKVRIVPVLPIAREAIDAYMIALPYPLKPDEPIFRAIRGGVMNNRQAALLMENIRNILGLPLSATPHALRHSFASHLLAAGGDIRAIQELLGHSSLSATQVYTKLDETQLIDIYRQAHPRGKS